jgi:hypothetical protein
MTLAELDSRNLLGTDIEHSCYGDSPVGENGYIVYPKRQTIRVIISELAGIVRMSAPELDIIVEGADQGEVWRKFLEEIQKREDGAWLSFDVGPTRHEEIEQGLDAPEDEDWSELS